MSKLMVKKYGGLTLDHPVAIVGFPTVGLVGSILSSYVSKEKKMKLIAGASSESMPPYALIQNGLPYHPIRVFGCKVEMAMNDLVVITSEITPQPDQCYGLAMGVLEILKDLGVSKTYVIEGVAQYENAKTVVCGTKKSSVRAANKHGLVTLNDGLIRGTTGVMLYEGKDMDLDILALMCPANPSMPDPRASANTLDLLSKMIPGMDLPSEPLMKEAEEMEDKIRSEMHADVPIHGARNLYG